MDAMSDLVWCFITLSTPLKGPLHQNWWWILCFVAVPNDTTLHWREDGRDPLSGQVLQLRLSFNRTLAVAFRATTVFLGHWAFLYSSLGLSGSTYSRGIWWFIFIILKVYSIFLFNLYYGFRGSSSSSFDPFGGDNIVPKVTSQKRDSKNYETGKNMSPIIGPH